MRQSFRTMVVPVLGGICMVVAGCGSSNPAAPAPPDTLPTEPRSCRSSSAAAASTVSTSSATARHRSRSLRSASPSPGAGSVSPSPYWTKLEWRAEQDPDGAIRMTVGDVDAAPRDPRAIGHTDYRAPGDALECDDVRIVKARGWWCTTTVGPIQESGAIVVSGGTSHAQIRYAGFTTRCFGHRPGPIRQTYQIERDSWTSWRFYQSPQTTAWTTAQNQTVGRGRVPCPQGRVGTYRYRMAITLDIQGLTAEISPASSVRIRTDCGTGIS
jgi:hypothetical protein